MNFLRHSLIKIVFVVLGRLLVGTASAQFAPTSLDYAITNETVTSGTYPFASSGSVSVVYTKGRWASYAATGDIAPSGVGTYTYSQTGPNTGVIYTTRQDLSPVFSTVFTLLFTTASSGTMYGTGAYNGISGSVSGTFSATLLQPVSSPPPAALVEVYEMSTEPTSNHRLLNISTRGGIGSGSTVFTAGFIVSGSSSESVLIRAVGPSLGLLGVTGTAQTTSLTLYDSSGKIIASASAWGAGPILGTSTVKASIQQATASQMASVGAFALPTGSKDSAMVATLPLGNYTVSVGGS